ncbi:hypothetical protein LMH87_009802 [Akanthomyces muscarius]|uniref:Uncharacterized protein n=1 Tax=Akanthomyces muscarius TaxID=2231603 RepID=A0A9W8UM93_AKAMU|nr:hypothetical protein LMH87_009802 [Akanthomyces muscarius]KAJ4153310.1 hypothetical protein LMH87_009802 [Akanthomyces muscarius]
MDWGATGNAEYIAQTYGVSGSKYETVTARSSSESSLATWQVGFYNARGAATPDATPKHSGSKAGLEQVNNLYCFRTVFLP